MNALIVQAFSFLVKNLSYSASPHAHGVLLTIENCQLTKYHLMCRASQLIQHKMH